MNNNINNSINSNANITSSDSGNSKSSSIRGIPASAAAAYEEGLQCYSEAVKHYKSAASTDAAVCLLLRIAAAREKEKTPESAEAAAAAYEDALHLRSASGKQQETAEVYKHYICMLALRSSFLGSPEFAAGAAAVDAFKHGDAAAAAAALESPVFRLLLPPVASLAARMAAEARERCTSSACNPIGEVGIGAEAVDALLAG
ncbi:hypothetical protein, conserved [Eimeria tenella]|uniref:Uncharacterized protein n=1 Tax=Eimeria tenella TaxID=5802 RepID=U6KYL4_EIMTE|nr:hypothetical protein, conserved [Eimeria tenella]CDJ43051.1 hypothetical protein, conserved [Eimeria tenella]|eukprot:XP_013233801.1 hypothetical protein, conserved [Eimeria tenella]